MPFNGDLSIAVFGGTGFIGSNFANYAARGGSRVVACGNVVPSSSMLDASIDVALVDATNLSTSLDLLRKIRPDVIVFSISAISPRGGKDADPAAVLSELRSLGNVIQGAHECGVQQIVFCSSGGAIYGEKPAAHVETDVGAPKSLYGQLKVQAEALVMTLCAPLGIRTAILRLGNPYGPGQSPFGLHGVIAVFAYKMMTAEPIRIFGSLDAVKDYVFVDDVSAAISASVHRRANGVYNIASGVPVSLRTLVKKISEVCAAEPTMEYVELSTTEVSTFTLDISKAKRELDWVPLTDLDTGIAKTKLWIERAYLTRGRSAAL